MDGGRRLLQSVKAALAGKRGAEQRRAAAEPVLAPGAAAAPAQRTRRRAPPRRRVAPRTPLRRAAEIAVRRGFGTALVLAFAIGVGLFGFVRGGSYQTFVAENGSPGNILARIVGFRIDAITISGQRELLSTEILKASGIREQDSLLFLDVDAVREKLVEVPSVQSANVRKLYPNQLVITVVERKAHAVWQHNGEVAIIAADGQVIDRMHDQRYARLPFVVGAGANKRLSEYMSILQGAGALRSKIRAGTLIGERRWTIKFSNGLHLKLPEDDPVARMRQFAALALKHDLLEKDLLVVDMRVPGRVIGELSAEAKEKMFPADKKPRRKGGNA